MYKRAGRLAVNSVERWLDAPGGARQLKNMFEPESKYGVEGYAYYDKYMITAASFLFIGFPFADDDIEEFPCPAELGGYVYEPAKHFHKVFANCGSYSIEEDISCDFFYDATGLGRIHRAGAPTELALSTPSGRMHHHRFQTPGCDNGDMSLCPGWRDGESTVFLAQFGNNGYRSFEYIRKNFGSEREFEDFISSFPTGLECETGVLKQEPEEVVLQLKYSGDLLPGVNAVEQEYKLSREGLEIQARLIDPDSQEISYMVPAFLENGMDVSNISCNGGRLTVSSMGRAYTVETDGVFEKTNRILGNRNGRYAIYVAHKQAEQISMKFKIVQKESENETE
jgi:hypothetical protein